MTVLDRPATGSRPALVRLAAVAVAVIGALLLLLAVARVTVWATPAHTVVHVAGQPGKPLVVTTAAALALDGPSVRVSVRAADPSQDVFVGVGRAADVEAYLGNAARTEITGVKGSDAVLATSGSDATLPEPAGVDVWALATTGRGTASLVWPRADGSWRLVAGVDGATPPAEVVVDWQRERGSSLTPALFAIGGLLLVLGLVGVRAARGGPGVSRRRPVPGAGPDERDVDDAGFDAAGADAAVADHDAVVDDDAAVDEGPAPFRSEQRS